MNIEIVANVNPISDEKREAILQDPGFGTYFTDHMVLIKYNVEKGWHDAQVKAYEPISCDPSSMVFHYGQAIFEGMKAYRTPGNELVLTRPYDNANRFNRSAKRMAMAEIDEELFVESLKQLVRTDSKWVPEKEGQSLYLRPFMIASEAHLGMRAANEYLFIVIACPVNPFFSSVSGASAISIYATTEYVRAVQGGTGEAKCSGNYAASLLAKKEALDKDCQDILWRDAKEGKYIEEMGTSNVAFIVRNGDAVTLLTPALSGSILKGITRDSIIQIAKRRGYEVREEVLVYDEVIEKIRTGVITEVFSIGTAVTIAPVGYIVDDKNKTQVGDGGPGEISMSIRQELCDLHFGKLPDDFGWHVKI
jgi:branched-chain amino acid aminotransferase